MTRTERIFAFLVVLGAFLVRVWMLDDRPTHFDEGVNGSFVDEMRSQGYYAYDPQNYHGPLHFYALFAAQQLGGRSLWALRMPTVLIGTAAVALMFAFRRWLSFRATLVAALTMALSPAMIFYSRDAIHEMWLVFFVMLASYGGMGLMSEPGPRDRWWLGLGLTGMILTKETYLLHFVAAAAAWGCVWLMGQATGGALAFDERPDAAALFNPRRQRQQLAILGSAEAERVANRKVFAVCIGLLIAFYSGFGMHWAGAIGPLETWSYMFHKGYSSGPNSEEGHHKAWWYYGWLLCRYEWPAVIGVVMAPLVAISPARNVPVGLRFLALFGLGSLAGYSLISYKTPWCMIAALPAFFLVVGWLFDQLAAYVGEGSTERLSMALLLVMLLGQPAWSAWRLNFRNPTNDEDRLKTGYVYVQTTRDIEKLLKPLRALIARDPLNKYVRGKIFSEPSPLVWELNDLPGVEFIDATESPQDDAYDADFLLFPRSAGPEVEYPGDREWEIRHRLRGVYFEIPYLPRAYGEPCWLFLNAERFGEFYPGREPEFHPRVREEAAR